MLSVGGSTSGEGGQSAVSKGPVINYGEEGGGGGGGRGQ